MATVDFIPREAALRFELLLPSRRRLSDRTSARSALCTGRCAFVLIALVLTACVAILIGAPHQGVQRTLSRAL